jgi:hypothetical protein
MKGLLAGSKASPQAFLEIIKKYIEEKRSSKVGDATASL